jgi:hypothetical protein
MGCAKYLPLGHRRQPDSIFSSETLHRVPSQHHNFTNINQNTLNKLTSTITALIPHASPTPPPPPSSIDQHVLARSKSALRARGRLDFSDPKLVLPVAHELMRRHLHNLRLARTNLGYVGLFPPLSQASDLLCILDGFSVPVVLRKSGDGYEHVGACYVPGLMEGEARKLRQDSRGTMEHIRII